MTAKPRTAAQLRALRARVMVLAWRAARVAVTHRPNRDVVGEMRAALAGAWAKAREEERNGWLRLAVASVPALPRTTASLVHVAALRAAIEDMENRDRLGVAGIERLSALRAELARAWA